MTGLLVIMAILAIMAAGLVLWVAIAMGRKRAMEAAAVAAAAPPTSPAAGADKMAQAERKPGGSAPSQAEKALVERDFSPSHN